MATVVATHTAGDGYPEFSIEGGSIEEVIVEILGSGVPVYRIHVPEWFDEGDELMTQHISATVKYPPPRGGSGQVQMAIKAEEDQPS